MHYVRFDLGKVDSRICLITADGELIEKCLKTERESINRLECILEAMRNALNQAVKNHLNGCRRCFSSSGWSDTFCALSKYARLAPLEAVYNYSELLGNRKTTAIKILRLWMPLDALKLNS